MGEYKRIDWDKEIALGKKSVKAQKELKKEFQEQRSGEQLFQEKSAKLFAPITTELQKDSLQLQNEVRQGKQAILDSQSRMLEYNPYYDSSIDKSKTEEDAPPIRYYDINQYLDEDDREILEMWHLPLPSDIDKNDIDTIKKQVTSHNRSIGQKLSNINKDKNTDEQNRVYERQRQTLEKYREALEIIKPASKYQKGEGLKKRVMMKKPRGRPKIYHDIVYYNDANDLVSKLENYIVAKRAGNTGVDNIIINILDELLEKKPNKQRGLL